MERFSTAQDVGFSAEHNSKDKVGLKFAIFWAVGLLGFMVDRTILNGEPHRLKC